MGKRELVALLNLSSWCLVMVERLFLAVPRGCLQFVIVVFPDHTHLLILMQSMYMSLPNQANYKNIRAILKSCQLGKIYALSFGNIAEITL